MRNVISGALAVAGCTFLSTTAVAQTEEVAPEDLRKAVMTKTSTTVPDGWNVTAKLGGSVNVVDARNVVGTTEGTAIQVGLDLAADANYKKGQHTWGNVLRIQEALQRTPPPDDDTPAPFVKSLDNLDLVSTYIYRFSEPDWLGPFVQLKFNTQLFRTTTEPSQDFRINRIQKDGTEIRDADTGVTRVAGDAVVRQTAPFEPFLLRQTAGLFGEPFAEDVFTLNFKVGVGAQEIISRDGFNLVNVEVVDDIPTYTLQQLESTVDIGFEGTVAAKGYILKDVLTWNAQAVAFLPVVVTGNVVKVDSAGVVVRDADDNPETLSAIERLNFEFLGGLSLKVTKYVSMDWNLLVRRFPQVRDAFQVTNSFLLTLTMDLI